MIYNGLICTDFPSSILTCFTLLLNISLHPCIALAAQSCICTHDNLSHISLRSILQITVANSDISTARSIAVSASGTASSAQSTAIVGQTNANNANANANSGEDSDDCYRYETYPCPALYFIYCIFLLSIAKCIFFESVHDFCCSYTEHFIPLQANQTSLIFL